MSMFVPNYYVACRIQDKILNMMGVKPQFKRNHRPEETLKLKPGELASLTKAFDTMEERKRILRNKPLPKAAEVKEKVKKPVHTSFIE